jgi:hypothetical protein
MGKRSLVSKDLFPLVNASDLSQARVIVAYAPLSADAVLARTRKFSEAFVQAQRMKAEQTADDEKRLSPRRPPLDARIGGEGPRRLRSGVADHLNDLRCELTLIVANVLALAGDLGFGHGRPSMCCRHHR